MVQFVAQPVIPFNESEVHSHQLVGGMFSQHLQESWQAFAEIAGDVQARDPLGKSKESLDHQLDGVVDADHCQAARDGTVPLQQGQTMLQDFTRSPGPGRHHGSYLGLGNWPTFSL